MIKKTVLLLSITFLTLNLSAEEKLEEILGKALVSSVVNNDIVAYSQCWTSSRSRKNSLKKYFPQIPDQHIKKMLQKLIPRNKVIVSSFEKRQDYINLNKIDRKVIKFKSCIIKYNKEEIINGHKMISATQFIISMQVNDEEWLYRMDDCGIINNQWYFDDRPIDLKIGDQTIKFRK